MRSIQYVLAYIIYFLLDIMLPPLYLSPEDLLVVPTKKTLGRIFRGVCGKTTQSVSVKWIVCPPVLEIVFESAAYFDPIFRCDGDVAAVEEAMEIASEQEAVIHRVGAAFIEWLDVGGLESGQRMFIRTGYREAVVSTGIWDEL